MKRKTEAEIKGAIDILRIARQFRQWEGIDTAVNILKNIDDDEEDDKEG